jgi:hypothetical protein
MDQREKRDRKKNPGSVHVGFVVDKVTLGQVFNLKKNPAGGMDVCVVFAVKTVVWNVK